MSPSNATNHDPGCSNELLLLHDHDHDYDYDSTTKEEKTDRQTNAAKTKEKATSRSALGRRRSACESSSREVCPPKKCPQSKRSRRLTKSLVHEETSGKEDADKEDKAHGSDSPVCYVCLRDLRHSAQVTLSVYLARSIGLTTFLQS